MEYMDMKGSSKRCDVCGSLVMVDKSGCGECKHCGWYNHPWTLENPDGVCDVNFMTLNHAREQHLAKKPLRPSFDEFKEMVRTYGEMEFAYKGTRYGVIRGKTIELFNATVDDGKDLKRYGSLDDFIARADIKGRLVKDLWSEVSGVSVLQ